MFTTNFYKYLQTLFGIDQVTNGHSVRMIDVTGVERTGYVFDTGRISRVQLLGTVTQAGYGRPCLITIHNGSTRYYGTYSTVTDSPFCVMIGTGTGEPTINDYNFSGDYITTFSATTSVTSSTTNGLEMIGTYVITNTGSDAFTIGEVGFFTYDDTTNYNRIMLEHTKLTTPLTIGAGETKSLVYRINMGGSNAS